MPFKTLPTFKTIAAISSLLLLGSAAQAHQVWLEQDGKEAKLYFGEFGENLRETSPGLLDKFVKPTGQKISSKGSESLALSKTTNGFALAGRAARGESLVAEEATYPVSERKQGDKVTRSLYQPAARLVTDHAQQQAVLMLDLVPTGKGKDGRVEVQVFYKSQPLPKAKVLVVTASGWAQEHHTDAEGKLSLNLPWAGTYVLELSHADATGGERAGEKYDRANYVTSLTLEQSAGLAALPAHEASPPNK